MAWLSWLVASLFLPPGAVRASEVPALDPNKEVQGELDSFRHDLEVLKGHRLGLEMLKRVNSLPEVIVSEEARQKLAQSETDLNALWQKLTERIGQDQQWLQSFWVGEKVRAAPDLGDYAENRYDRWGYRRATLSDCTWYAAEAVKLASNGRIDLNDRKVPFGEWGNAGRWASRAENWGRANPGGPIIGVDKIPRPGDIVEWNSHLAFVEQVRGLRDEGGNLVRYHLTLSEENATGQSRPNSQPLKLPDDPQNLIRRWRSTLDVEIKNGQEAANTMRFIHFNYN